MIAGHAGLFPSALRSFDRWFPMPLLLAPRTLGVDISDASVKWLGMERRAGRPAICSHGSLSLPEGVVARGVVRDVHALAQTLAAVGREAGVSAVHAALPEEGAYVFAARVPAGSSREQALRLVEFELDGRVPIAPSEAVYDYDIVDPHAEEEMEISVCAFPRALAESYALAFAEAGLLPFSFELEARSIARAVSGGAGVELLVDYGHRRTGLAVLKDAVPIFTTTVEVGSERMDGIVSETLSVADAEANRIKNEEGLLASGVHEKAREALLAEASLLCDEIVRHFRFWDTRRDEKGKRMTPVSRVILVGGGANLKGLADLIAGKVQAPVERGNVWRRAFSFDEEIPPIDRRTSLRFATAAGLALRSV